MVRRDGAVEETVVNPRPQGQDAATGGENADPEDRRIREAALELFTSQGFRNVRAADVCGKAGVPLTSFERRYSSTFDLLKQLYEEITVDVVDNVMAAL